MKTLRDALLAEELTLTAELALTPRQSATEVIEQAQLLAGVTDAVQIPDHRHAVPHISNIAVAAHLVRAGIDPIMHMNCRDRNRIALQSDLLSAHSLGVTNLLLMRGSKLPADHLPKATNVFDLGAIDLIATAAAIRDGDVFVGARAPEVRDFYVGTVATVFNAPSRWQPEKLITKADAGAQFIQLQICLNMAALRAYMTRLVAAKLTWRFQVMVGLAVLPSAEEARLLRKNFPDSMVPAAIVKRLKQADDPEQEGVQICAELLREIVDVPGIAGVSLMTPGDPATIPAAIRASGVRPDLRS